ncbi:uncharacterized protein LOC135108651 [Scylla paramamosain]|uniref:uncharacterized protein LOC135108651 n=1 Tax=Scylla paramamosain TaxID=85552 RepID=UPI00308349EC
MRFLSWCLTVVVVSDDPSFLSAFAEVSDRGRLIVWETKLLVVTRLDLLRVEALLQGYWIFSMMNTMFLTPKYWESERWQVFTYLPYTPEGSKVMCIAKESSREGLIIAEGYALFPEKYKNFHKMPVNMSVFPLPPHWSETVWLKPDGSRESVIEGRDYLIIKAISDVLNFSINPLPYKGWDPVLERLRTREALIRPINYPVMAHMVAELDFSFFLEPSALAFAFAKPTIEPTWQALYHPMQVEVWISILITVFLVYGILLLMMQGTYSDGSGAWMVLKQVVGTLLDEAIPGELPRKNSTRVLLTVWLIFAFIVGTVYRSNLTASLTAPKYPPRPETLADLVDMGITVTIMKRMDIFLRSFKDSGSETLRTFSERVEYVPSYKEGLPKILTENKAHMYERLYLEMKVAEDFTQKDGSTPLYVTQGNLMPGYASFPLVLDAPFKTNIDNCLIAIHGGGLINYWTRKVISKIKSANRKRMNVSQPEDTSSGYGRALTLVHMQGPFFLYLICVFASLAAFLREVVSRFYYVGHHIAISSYP